MAEQTQERDQYGPFVAETNHIAAALAPLGIEVVKAKVMRVSGCVTYRFEAIKRPAQPGADRP